MAVHLVDVNCGLGRVPGRSGGVVAAAELLRSMDRLGIARALVYPLAFRTTGWTYANHWLMERLHGHKRLIPCWGVAPEPTGEFPPAELVATMKRAGVGAVRLCPKSQHHLLNAVVCGRLLTALEKARMPVILDYEIIGWGSAPDWAAIAEVAEAFPRLPLIVPGSVLGASRNFYPYFLKHHNLYLDIGAFQEVGGLARFVQRIGAHRALFGTYFPERGAEIALGLIHGRQLGPHARCAIGGGNLEALLAGRRPEPVPCEPPAPGARLPVPAIDVHLHLGASMFGAVEFTAEDAIAAFDAWGVDCGIAADMALLSGDVLEANRRILRACQRFPGRLFGWVFFDAAESQASAAIAEEMLRHRCMVGFKVHEGTDQRRLDDPGYAPMFAMADKGRLPILAHENVHDGFDRTLSRIGRKWPHVAILHAHHGGTQDEAGARKLAALMRKHTQLWTDTSTSFAPPDAVANVVRAGGGKRLCYGSDLGFMDNDGQIGKVLFADLRPNQRADVLRHNALRLIARLKCTGRS